MSVNVRSPFQTCVIVSSLAGAMSGGRAQARASGGACIVGLTGGLASADAMSMWTVPIPNRPAAQAMQVILMHALGDVPSPPIVGAIQGVLPFLACAFRTSALA